MAKMFYTLEETKSALGRSDEELKQLTQEGRLREFRDGQRLMYKADQVDTLKTEIQTANEPLDLGGSGDVLPLSDTRSGTGGAIPLESADTGVKEDTALAADLGLSGSVGGMPSPGRSAGGSAMGSSRPGIDVLHDDEAERVDPSAQTAITSGVGEGAPMEGGVGSGSGLLDLTKESDDTSLGAELLDEIAPSGTGLARKSPGDSGSGMVVDSRVSRAGAGGPVMYEKEDPMAPAFGAAALAATIVVIFGAFALISGVLDTTPDLLTKIHGMGHQFIIVAGGGLGLVLVFFVAGMIMGKAAAK